jgi:hypothetical protein
MSVRFHEKVPVIFVMIIVVLRFEDDDDDITEPIAPCTSLSPQVSSILFIIIKEIPVRYL